ncbi:hypothetical protein B0H14DRAFT_2890525 [Mycena olivaceomarginata]|nr:hypothetical protein B0H14DRAFT_2890525 [Mycena olivaceomarginata]
MAASVFSLPVPLFLLIHLHLLQYPHANKPEYDHTTMEDVCYFLVSRIAGTKERVRKAIPTYPCLQPAHSTAFRTSLAKFLQDLRHISLSSTALVNQSTDKTTAPAAEVKNVAWWWKDVVVRKSLLEECGGERFERLMLALSTHALLKGSSNHVEQHETLALLRNQPRVYMTRLATFQSCRNSWARAASLLTQRQYDLGVLRANIETHGGSHKCISLTTEKLVAVADSRLQDALAVQWAGSSGYAALKLLSDMFGLKQPESSPETTSSSARTTDTTDKSALPHPRSPSLQRITPPTLRKLGTPIFPKATGEIPQLHTPTVHAASRAAHTAIALADAVDAEDRMTHALSDGLARTRRVTNEIKARLTRRPAMQKSVPLRAVNMNLWQDTHQLSIDFEPRLTEHAVSTLGLSALHSAVHVTLDARIDAVRCDLLPKYPPGPGSSLPISESTTARAPPPTEKRMRIRREMPTAPETVKPLTRHTAAAPSQPSTSFLDSAGNTRPIQSHSYSHSSGSGLRNWADDDRLDNDAFDEEGPSMSVRDLLLRADTTYFDIIGHDDDDESSELGEQSFGWA